jgi:hypothetical protein
VSNPETRAAKLEAALKDLTACVQDCLDLFSRVHEKKLSTDHALQGLFNRAQERVTQIEQALGES